MSRYLEPIVNELKQLDEGIECITDLKKFYWTLKARLICVACDIPAARKVCGFMGHSAEQGCSRCKKSFPRRDSKFFFSFFLKKKKGKKRKLD